MQLNQQYQEDKWNTVFGKANGQFELALDTYMHIGDKGDFYFEFEGTPIRWCNGTDRFAPLVIVPIQNGDNYELERALLRRFLSQLSYQQNIAIGEITSIGSGRTRLQPWLTAPYHYGGFLVTDPRFKELVRLTNRQKLTLALYREALNSVSTYYALLVYFKIIEIASGPNKTDEWIGSHLDPQRIYKLQEWVNKVPKGRTPGQYLREAHRNAVAHVDEILNTGDPTLDPDDLTQRAQAEEANDVVKELARLAMSEILPQI